MIIIIIIKTLTVVKFVKKTSDLTHLDTLFLQNMDKDDKM